MRAYKKSTWSAISTSYCTHAMLVRWVQEIRVVMILMPVISTKNAGIGIGEYVSQILSDLLATKWYPATSQLAQLALTDVAYLKSFIFVTVKQYTGSCTVLPLSARPTIF